MVRGRELMERSGEDRLIVAAACAGDESAFGALAERYRRELQVHCYRMLGSFEEAEDLVQKTLLRAWRKRDTFEGRSTFRAWLYRIATNACLDFLARHPRQPVPRQQAATDPEVVAAAPPDIAWLQPYPDRLFDPVAPADAEPDAQVVAKVMIELAFLAAIQHLPPRQRAMLILRDVLGWSANEMATLLEVSMAAVKSGLQRAHGTLKTQLPEHRLQWAPSAPQTAEEHSALLRFMIAFEQANTAAMTELLSEDVRLTMPSHPMWTVGCASVAALVAAVFDPGSPFYHGHWRLVPTRANRQPAFAKYNRRASDTAYHAQSLDVLRIKDGKVAEITIFVPALFPAFDLPLTL